MSDEIDDRLERDLLVGAQAGDEEAFRLLVELHRGDLHAHCYRMLGVLADADDAYQDTMLRAWRALDGFEGRSRLSTWLHRIASNVCLDALRRSARRRVVSIDDPATPDPASWVGPYPDGFIGVADGFADPSARFERRESLELAFVAALQLLPARQRAVLILIEILGFAAAEVADMLTTTVPAVNSALQRARARLDQSRPTLSQQSLMRAMATGEVSAIVERFAAALEAGDTATLADLLSADVVFDLPSQPAVARGRDDVMTSWLVPVHRPTGLRTVITRMNGQPAVAVYLHRDDAAPARAIAVDVLELDGDGISRITAFRDLPVMGALGLPVEVAQ